MLVYFYIRNHLPSLIFLIYISHERADQRRNRRVNHQTTGKRRSNFKTNKLQKTHHY
jgi:hypothetical protein